MFFSPPAHAPELVPAAPLRFWLVSLISNAALGGLCFSDAHGSMVARGWPLQCVPRDVFRWPSLGRCRARCRLATNVQGVKPAQLFGSIQHPPHTLHQYYPVPGPRRMGLELFYYPLPWVGARWVPCITDCASISVLFRIVELLVQGLDLRCLPGHGGCVLQGTPTHALVFHVMLF